MRTPPESTGKILSVPVEDEETGELRFVKIGVRVTLDTYAKDVFFHSYSHGTWTRRRQGSVKRYKSLTPVTNSIGQVEREPEKVSRFKSTLDMIQRLKHCPSTLAAVMIGVQLAESGKAKHDPSQATYDSV